MNFNASTIVIALVIIIAVPYLIVVMRRASQNFPLAKALNPFYTKEMLAADDLKESIHPILDEIATQRVANFVKFWSHKFDKNGLTMQDVEGLNAQIAAGDINQVNGILAIHPEGKKLFNLMNEKIKLKEEALTSAGAAVVA